MALHKCQFSAKILGKELIAGQTCLMQLEAPQLAGYAHAGHFVNILIPQAGELMWRRPFSIHAVDRSSGVIELLFSTAGRGGLALSRALVGNEVETLGLLGNVFTYPDNLQEAVIVAGGLGVAPFRLMLQDLAPMSIKKTVFVGVASQDRLCCLQAMADLGAQLHVSTDDGSYGQKGPVTADLEKYLTAMEKKGRMLYVCGPTPMMRRVQELAHAHGLAGQVTVENRMACGFGACMGCPVELARPKNDGKRYLLACKDGPVFPLDEILLND